MPHFTLADCLALARGAELGFVEALIEGAGVHEGLVGPDGGDASGVIHGSYSPSSARRS